MVGCEKGGQGESIVAFPSTRPLRPGLLGSGVEGVGVRMGTDGFFALNVSSASMPQRLEEYPLPAKPAHLPGWDHALVLPHRAGGRSGLLFLLGGFCCFWSVSSGAPVWRLSGGLGSVRMAMIAVSTCPSPFLKFSEEMMLAAQLHSDSLGDLPSNPWPPNMHRYWLCAMLETRPVCPESHIPGLPARIVRLPQSEITRTLARLRLGMMVSSVHRAKSELPFMLEMLSEKNGVPVEDVFWEKLPELCGDLP